MVLFLDAAHFVQSSFLGSLWCFKRLFVRSSSGRQRWNVLGALDAVSRKVHTFCNDTYINSESVCEQQSRFVVRFTELDINRHVIASQYMRWIMDSYPIKVLENEVLKSFELNYLAEAQLGDEIEVKIQSLEDGDLCSITRISDDAELCRARAVWHK